MIDVRKEFEKLLDELSIKCLYVHSNKKMKCSCFNELHGTGMTNHILCGGTGFLNVVERVNLINHGMGINFEVGDFKTSEIGNVYSNLQVFYSKYDLNPLVQDYILVTGFDGKIPRNVIKVYEITAVDEVRGDKGRVEVNMLLTKARPDLVKTYQDKLNSFTKIVKLKGREILCP